MASTGKTNRPESPESSKGLDGILAQGDTDEVHQVEVLELGKIEPHEALQVRFKVRHGGGGCKCLFGDLFAMPDQGRVAFGVGTIEFF